MKTTNTLCPCPFSCSCCGTSGTGLVHLKPVLISHACSFFAVCTAATVPYICFNFLKRLKTAVSNSRRVIALHSTLSCRGKDNIPLACVDRAFAHEHLGNVGVTHEHLGNNENNVSRFVPEKKLRSPVRNGGFVRLGRIALNLRSCTGCFGCFPAYYSSVGRNRYNT